MNYVLRKIAAKVLLMPKVKQEFKRIHAFYDMQVQDGDTGWLDIEEAFTEGDAKALENLVRMVRRENVMIVEIGSWKGFSTSILARSVVDCHGSVFAVDHWMGNEGTWNYDVTKVSDIYSIFKRNMISLGLGDIVHPLVMDSQTASQIFSDGILDLIFIDADHTYEPFKKDILAWLPKLRDGGILCGHDCEGYYSEYSEEVKKKIEEHRGDDYISGICHPGVIKAIHEYFQDRYS